MRSLAGAPAGAMCAVVASFALVLAEGPRARAEELVSLEALLAYASEHAPSLTAARARLALGAAARAGAASIFAGANPSLEISAGAGFVRSPGKEPSTSPAVGGTLLVPIEIAGERGRRLAAATATTGAAEARVLAAEVSLRYEVTGAYADAVVAAERLTAAEKLASFADELVKLVERRLAAGAASSLDVDIVRGDTGSARAELAGARGNLEVARLRLAELTGWPAGDPPRPSIGLAELPAPRPAPARGALLALAARTSPELAALARTVTAARASLAVAEREAAPRPAIGIAVERDEPALTVIRGILSVPLPVFGRNQAARALAAAEVEMAAADVAALEAVLPARVAAAAARVDAAWKRAGAFAEALPTVERTLTLGRKGVELGSLDLLDLAALQRRALELQREGLGAVAEYHRAAAALAAVLGVDPWAAAVAHGAEAP